MSLSSDRLLNLGRLVLISAERSHARGHRGLGWTVWLGRTVWLLLRPKMRSSGLTEARRQQMEPLAP